VEVREEHKLGVFENRVLRKIFAPQMEKVTGECWRLHNEELMICTPFHVIKSRRMIWAGHVARMGDRIGACRVFVRKPVGKRQLGRPRHRWEDNIKTDIQEVGWGAWSRLIRLRTGEGGVLL
jgi:hypothetical protein